MRLGTTADVMGSGDWLNEKTVSVWVKPLPGAVISILDHPEFGQTLSRADGRFDLAVNGGGILTVNYEKAGYLPALFTRLRARRGPKKAIIAVAAAILTAVYWMLRRGTTYQDLGTDYFERTDRQRLATKLVRKLDQLGFTVTLAQRQTT